MHQQQIVHNLNNKNTFNIKVRVDDTDYYSNKLDQQMVQFMNKEDDRHKEELNMQK
jgi:hypothetical protein